MSLTRRTRRRTYHVTFDVVFPGYSRTKLAVEVTASNKQKAEMVAEETMEDQFPRAKWPVVNGGRIRPRMENLSIRPKKLR